MADTDNQTSHATAPTRAQIAKVVLLIAILGAIGIAIKAPFGVHLLTIAGNPPQPRASFEWHRFLFFTEWGRLLISMALGYVFYQYAGFRSAPFLERRVFGEPSLGWRRVVLPGLIIALVLTGLTLIGLIFSQTPPLAVKLVSGEIPHDQAMKLLWLWPLGFTGAGLSEEVLYRFGMIVPIAGFICMVAGKDKPRVALVAFWIANLAQAFYFGWGHVEDGVVASNSGGWLIATLLAPQTWVGVMFGYIFRRWGLECAIICHALIDLFIPGLLVLWAYWTL